MTDLKEKKARGMIYINNMIPSFLIEDIQTAKVSLIELLGLLNHCPRNYWTNKPSFQNVLQFNFCRTKTFAKDTKNSRKTASFGNLQKKQFAKFDTL